jgi:hypothetical protein
MTVQMSTIWDRTTAFAGSALSAVLPIALLLFVLPLTIEHACAPIIQQQGPLIRLTVTFVLWVVELTGTLALIVLALGATLSPGEAVRAAAARLPIAVGIMVLLGLLAALAALPIGIIMATSGVDLDALQAGNTAAVSAMAPGSTLFIALYALAYVVLLIWATARLLVVDAVILAERRGLGAILRSVRLTRGLTWRIIGVLILYAIVATVAVLAARTVFGSIFALFAGGDGAITLATILTAIIVAIVSAGFKTVAALFIGKLYAAIVESEERFAEAS